MDKKTFVDVFVFCDDDRNYGVGAEFIEIEFPEHEVTKVASLFYAADEFTSINACLKTALPELLRQTEAKTVKFRSKMQQFKRSDQFARPLTILAGQGRTIEVSYRRSGGSDHVRTLALDALKRKANVIADIN